MESVSVIETLSSSESLCGSSETIESSTSLIHVIIGRGMAKTVQVRVALKVTFTVSSSDGVTVTLGGSEERGEDER